MRHLARFTAAAAFLLVLAGATVTSTGSGLAVPDWPLSYGSLFPPMVGGILYEHSHRLIAAAVGLLTLALTLCLLAKEPRTRVRWLGIGCLALVVFQGILGGLTVLWLLPAPVSVAHAAMGQTFFTAIILLAVVLSPRWSAEAGGWQMDPEGSRLTRSAAARPAGLPALPSPTRLTAGTRAWSLATVAVIYTQLLLGAAMRHAGWWPGLVAAHLAGAAAVAALIVQTAHGVLHAYHQESSRSSRPLWLSSLGLARLMLGLLALQLALGLVTFFFRRPVLAATAHVAVGALLLATSAVLALLVARREGARPPKGARPSRPLLPGLSVYLELTKPRLTALSVLTALAGFTLASVGAWDWAALAATLCGAGLVGAGAAALNQVMERDRDARMTRTAQRPVPSGRISAESALTFGVACSAAGLLILSAGAHPLAGALAAATLITYLFIYTPLKSRSALCTLAGAVPGALPPLIGWAAAAGRLDLGAWLLFSILFLWQLPHFLALAWKFKEDYARAGFKMLPVLDPDGGLTFRQMVLYTLALLPVSILPAALGLAGMVYFLAALAAGLAFLGFGLATAAARSDRAAHRFFLASVLYLPFLLTTLTLEKMLL